MNTKHTPGPWRFVNGRQICSEKCTIAKAWMMRNGEGVANARLIAAAPELLDSLIEVLDAAVDWLDDSTGHKPDGIEWYENAKAAIAKATGETQ